MQQSIMTQSEIDAVLELSDLQVFVDTYLQQVSKVENNYKTFLAQYRQDFSALKVNVLEKLNTIMIKTKKVEG